jgi:hypothetical protein
LFENKRAVTSSSRACVHNACKGVHGLQGCTCRYSPGRRLLRSCRTDGVRLAGVARSADPSERETSRAPESTLPTSPQAQVQMGPERCDRTGSVGPPVDRGRRQGEQRPIGVSSGMVNGAGGSATGPLSLATPFAP